jgi:hypothetical protein
MRSTEAALTPYKLISSNILCFPEKHPPEIRKLFVKQFDDMQMIKDQFRIR